MFWTGIEALAVILITVSLFLYGSRSRSGRTWAGIFGVIGALLWALLGAHEELYLMMGMNILFVGLYTRNIVKEIA